MEDMFRIGVITSTHGIKGEVKVFPTTDDTERFNTLKYCYIRTKDKDIKVEKNTCKFFKNMVILSFKEFKDITEVEKYKQCELYIDRENAIPLSEDEYYIADAIGSKVVLEDETAFGTLLDVLKTGANDVLVIKTDDGKEVLAPVIDECVLDIDCENKKIVIRLMKGLMD